jgi:hypothetical protein
MNGRRTLPQQTLDRLATLYEYADGDPAAGDEASAAARDVEDTIFVMIALYPVTVVGDQARLAAAERILLERLRPLNPVPVMIG